MKKFWQKLACSAACFTIVTGSANAITPEMITRINYVVEASLQHPQLASTYSRNFLGLEPDYNLISAAQQGNSEILRNMLINAVDAKNKAALQAQQYAQEQVNPVIARPGLDTVAVNKAATGEYLGNGMNTSGASDMASYTSTGSSLFSTGTLVMAGAGVAGVAGLAAIAGGGGGDSGASGGGGTTQGQTCASTGTTLDNCPQTSTPSSFRTTEFLAKYDTETESANDGMKVQYAYARDINGQGIKIGVLDQFDNNVLSDPEISGKIDTANSVLQSGGDPSNHGNWVSKFAAGSKNGTGAHGVAYNSTLVLHSYNVGSSFAQQVEDLANAGAKVINMSFGYIIPGTGGAPDRQVTTEPAEIANALSISTAANIVIVASAGNQCGYSDPNCGDPAYPARSASTANAAGTVIAVGAVEYNTSTSSYEIASYSNRAGDAKDFFVVAPASWGTSAAAPDVSGVVALVRQAWPHLSAAQTVSLILTTADDLGSAGVDTTYGHGLVNVQTIFTPVGGTSYINSSGSNTGTSLYNTYVQPSRAFGDALSANNTSTISFADSYNRVFTENAGYFTNNSRRQKSTDYINSMQRLAFDSKPKTIEGSGYKVEFSEYVNSNFETIRSTEQVTKTATRASFEASDDVTLGFGYGGEGGASLMDDYYSSGKSGFIKPEANFVPYLNMFEYEASYANVQTKFSDDDKLTVNFIYGRERDNDMTIGFNEARSMAAVANYKKPIFSNLQFGLTNGLVYEDGTILGAKSGGALKMKDGAQTMFIGADFKLNLTDDIALTAGGYKGYTNVDAAPNSIYSKFSTIETDSYSAGVESKNNFAKGDNLMLSFFQGLRVNRGSAQGNFFGQDASGAYVPAQFTQNLEPEGKEFTVQALYNMPVKDNVDISVAAQHTDNPNNIASAGAEQAILGKVRIQLDK